MNDLVENKKKWEALYDRVLAMNYGDVISHQDISAILDEPYGTNKFRRAIDVCKKNLLLKGKYIESIKGKGYRVVAPDDYNKLTVDEFVKGAKRIKKGYDILIYAPTEEMTYIGRDTHRNLTDRVRIIQASVAGSCVELNMLAKKPHALLAAKSGT